MVRLMVDYALTLSPRRAATNRAPRCPREEPEAARRCCVCTPGFSICVRRYA
jgi:hypothetical protein